MKQYFLAWARRDQSKSLWFFFIGLLTVLTIISSCTNEAAKDESKETTTLTTPEGGEAAITEFNGNFPVLSLTRTQLETFFTPTGPGTVQKLVFRFQFPDGNSSPTLVAYQAKNLRTYETNPLAPPLTKLPIPREITGLFILGNLELTRTKYLSLIDEAGTRTTLYFIPEKRPNNNVTYNLQWGPSTFTLASLDSLKLDTAKFNDVDNYLNPSPPDPPFGDND